MTNTGGDGLSITNSHNVTLSACSGRQSLGRGLSVNGLSDVSVDGPGSFDGNSNGGILINGNSALFVSPFSGPIEIKKNVGAGVWLSSGSLLSVLGSTSIEGNLSSPSPAVGIQSLGGTKVQIGACLGPVDISDNQDGGISSGENSELSLFDCGNPAAGVRVSGNGPVGISAGLGSQVTLYNNVQISGHSGSGVELYGKSQLNGFGTFVISGNGSGGNQRSAGIVADGNSEVYIRGGQVKGNTGPGILALVNSSADVVGASLTGNSGGIATCDSSAFLVSDLLSGPGKAEIQCRTPHNLSNRKGTFAAPVAPDLSVQKDRLAAYKRAAVR